MQQLRPLTDVEREYLAAIKRLAKRAGKFGIGDVAHATKRSRSATSKVVNRLAGRGEIRLGEFFAGCVRRIELA